MERGLAPGARITLRDEDWIVRRIDLSDDGGYALTCDGFSELVRGTTATFLDRLEDDIQLHDPAATELYQDPSPYFTQSLLYLEGQRLRTVANDQRIHRADRAAMKNAEYQRLPTEKGLGQVRTRILIADGTGLGKTLEAGMLVTELEIRGRGRRILVVTQKSMLTQFQKEWWSRFTIPLVRLDSAGIQRIRNNIPAGHNPFNYYDKTIVSMDTLKGNGEYRHYLQKSRWDIIVIDECHNVAMRKRDAASSQRARLAKDLATKSDTLILLSATPHDGSANSFASLIWLLDPTAISDPEDYTRADLDRKDLFVRRFKKDIKDQAEGQFPEPITRRLGARASAEEEAAYRALLRIPFTQKGEHHPGLASELQRVGLQKALFSSPAAADAAARHRIDKLRKGTPPTPAEAAEIAALDALRQDLARITPERFGKYQRLLENLGAADTGWTGRDSQDRLVIFSERLETLNWLFARLPVDLALPATAFTVLDGSLSDIDQQAIVERFGQEQDPLRVLLCSDVASEGLNLHYLCHRLIHFDLPWSPLVFQQRNGRVDRFGQRYPPRIDYLLTASTVERIQGDLRVIEVLVSKDEQISKNIGDPASILRRHSSEEEERLVAEALAEGLSAEAFAHQCIDEARAEDDVDDWEALIYGPPEAQAPAPASSLPSFLTSSTSSSTSPSLPSSTPLSLHSSTPSSLHSSTPSSPQAPAPEEAPTSPPHRLFPDFYRFAKEAMNGIAEAQGYQADDTALLLRLTPPPDLQRRLRRQLPAEVLRETDEYRLSAHPGLIEAAIQRAREADRQGAAWPDLQYLWPQHPISQWLIDRVIGGVGRRRAPVIISPHLAPGEQAFLMLGLIPNRKGQPLIAEWKAVVHRDAGAFVDAGSGSFADTGAGVFASAGAGAFTIESFDDFCRRARLHARTLPNRGRPLDLTGLQQALGAAVATMQGFVEGQVRHFSAARDQVVRHKLAQLDELRQAQERRLDIRLDGLPDNLRQARKARRLKDIEEVFAEYGQWVKDSLEIEPVPHVQVLAAVTTDPSPHPPPARGGGAI